MLYKGPLSVLFERNLQFFLRIYYNRPLPGDGLPNWFPGKVKKGESGQKGRFETGMVITIDCRVKTCRSW